MFVWRSSVPRGTKSRTYQRAPELSIPQTAGQLLTDILVLVIVSIQGYDPKDPRWSTAADGRAQRKALQTSTLDGQPHDERMDMFAVSRK